MNLLKPKVIINNQHRDQMDIVTAIKIKVVQKVTGNKNNVQMDFININNINSPYSNNEVYKSDKKGPVELSHAKHVKEYEAVCTDCHHEYKDGVNVWKEGDAVKKCVSCHDPEKTQDKAAKAQMAYHNNCKDCHKNSGKDTAPSSKCNDCHAAS